ARVFDARAPATLAPRDVSGSARADRVACACDTGERMEALFSDYETIRKSGLFDPEHYVATYPDVEERNVDPLVHYLEEGAPERRTAAHGCRSMAGRWRRLRLPRFQPRSMGPSSARRCTGWRDRISVGSIQAAIRPSIRALSWALICRQRRAARSSRC